MAGRWLEVETMDDIKPMRVLVPCPHCKGNGKVSFKNYRFIGKNFKGDRKIVYRV